MWDITNTGHRVISDVFGEGYFQMEYCHGLVLFRSVIPVHEGTVINKLIVTNANIGGVGPYVVFHDDNYNGLELVNNQPVYCSWIFTIIIEPNDCLTNKDQFKLAPVPFAKPYMRQLFTDVQFKIGDQMIKAHKTVLAERSDVFETMFTSQVTDPLKKDEPIVITDVTFEGFKAFLDLIYDHKMPTSPALAIEIMKTCDKYNVQSFVSMFESDVIQAISDQDVIQILVAADLYDAKKIKLACLQYMKKHSVADLPDFQLLSANISLLREVIRTIECRHHYPI